MDTLFYDLFGKRGLAWIISYGRGTILIIGASDDYDDEVATYLNNLQ